MSDAAYRFMWRKNIRLQRRVRQLEAALKRIAGEGDNPFHPTDDNAYFEVRAIAREALRRKAAQENDDE